MSKTRKVVLASVAATLLAVGAMALVTTETEARGPVGGPQCGPSFRWSCSGPGGPDVLFLGTVCEKNEYEQQTGRTCTRI